MDWTLAIGSLQLGIYDFIAIGLLLISSISCAFVGFSRSASKSFGIILSIPLALLFTSTLAGVIARNTSISIFFATLFSFVGLSLLIYILFYFVGLLLENTLEALHLSALNALLGFFWGLIVSAIVISILSALITYQPFIDFKPLFDHSILYKTFFKSLYAIIKENVNVIR